MQFLVYLQVLSHLANAALIKRQHLVTEVFVEENFTYDVFYAANKTSTELVGTEIFSFTNVVDLDATTLGVYTSSFTPTGLATSSSSTELAPTNTAQFSSSIGFTLTDSTASTTDSTTSSNGFSYLNITSAAEPSLSSSNTPLETSKSLTSTVSSSSSTSSTLAITTGSSISTTSSSSSSTLSSSSLTSSTLITTTGSTTSTSSASLTSSVSTPTDESVDDYNSNAFNNDILYEHNVKRALHGVQPLSWNTTLEAYAQAYADDYSCPSNGALVHSGGPYGENLASGFSSAFKTVDAWYDEIQYYNYSNPGFSEATGHFTQVVWKDTAQLGCAYKSCDTAFHTYVICSYFPAGNVIGLDWNIEVPQLI